MLRSAPRRRPAYILLHVCVKLIFQQQVPLPLPCVNFAQIAQEAILAKSGLCAPARPVLLLALFERDGRCVQSLILLHRDILMHDY
jgi:hypothetical protein